MAAAASAWETVYETFLPPMFEWPEDRWSVGSWTPGFLSDDHWTKSGDLSLREPPTEIRFLLARMDLGG